MEVTQDPLSLLFNPKESRKVPRREVTCSFLLFQEVSYRSKIKSLEKIQAPVVPLPYLLSILPYLKRSSF